MSLEQQAFKGVIWSVIQNWGSQVVSLIVFLILARLLTPEAFGLVALANTFLLFMQILLEQGFTQALIQRQELEPEHLNTAFLTNVLIGICLTILGWFMADTIAGMFDQPKLVPILKCFSILFSINSLRHVQEAILSRKMAFKIMAIRTLIAIFLGGIVGIVMAISGFGVWSLVSQQIVFESVSVLVLWQAVDWRPEWQFSRRHFQDLFSFGINVVGFKFLRFINKRSDNLIIGFFLGEIALGYYAIAYRVLEVMTQLLVSTSNQVALPTFAKLQTEPERFRQAFCRVTKLTSLIAFPTFLGMVALTPEIVTVVFGSQWIPSIPIMRILAFAGILYSLSYFNASVLMALGKPDWRLWISFMEALLSCIACLVAVKWGITAVAFAHVMSLYVVFPVGQIAVSKLIHVPMATYFQQFIVPLVSTYIMVVSILALKYFLGSSVNSGFLLISGTVTGMMIYGFMIRILDPELFSYLLQLFGTLKSKKT
ncbi:MAG: lipopolysaccharide biosynthesis protein [Oscillatoriales cyanobacterium RM2_1_1]|nr:lipopolysaccharide biosynthesis protein [Oscillatoriales cyanobacterium SM2_3_0]NJO44555.1 lipopolysaccharide biosynthesis protein [Oscillatoriales cyanobacterium RM2_1_1]